MLAPYRREKCIFCAVERSTIFSSDADALWAYFVYSNLFRGESSFLEATLPPDCLDRILRVGRRRSVAPGSEDMAYVYRQYCVPNPFFCIDAISHRAVEYLLGGG